MKTLYFRISAALLIALLAAIIYYFQSVNLMPNTNIIPYTPALGNILVSFFYSTHTNLVDAAQINFYVDQINKMRDSELKDFYLNLPWHTRHNLINHFVSKDDAAWNSLDETGRNKPHYLEFWQKLRPSIQSFYAKTLPHVKTTQPVIHFRCSDVPMSRHNQYHLTKASSVKWMAEQLKDRGFNRVTFLSCNTHNIIDNNNCTRYTNFYIDLFKAYGLEIDKKCNSVLHDFSLMYNSPLLISLNASSFSFMAGISKNPSNYISCNMGIEINGTYHLQNEADWILDSNYPLLHTEVEDYSKTHEVIDKLHS